MVSQDGLWLTFFNHKPTEKNLYLGGQQMIHKSSIWPFEPCVCLLQYSMMHPAENERCSNKYKGH